MSLLCSSEMRGSVSLLFRGEEHRLEPDTTPLGWDTRILAMGSALKVTALDGPHY